MYGYYLYKLIQCGSGTGWHKVWDVSYWKRETVVEGQGLAKAVVVCYAAAVMTVSKTVLYCEVANHHANVILIKTQGSTSTIQASRMSATIPGAD